MDLVLLRHIFTISLLWLLGSTKATASTLSLPLTAFPTSRCCSRGRVFTISLMLPLWYLVLLLLQCMVSSQSHAYGYLVLLRLRRLFSVSHLWLSQRYGAATVSHHDLALLATWYCYVYVHILTLTLMTPWFFSVSIHDLTPVALPTRWCRHGVSSQSRAYGVPHNWDSMSFLLGFTFTNNSALLRCRLFPRRFSLPLVLLRCCLFSRLFGFTMNVVRLRCRLLYHTHTYSFPLHRVARRIRLLSTLNLDRYGHVHLTS